MPATNDTTDPTAAAAAAMENAIKVAHALRAKLAAAPKAPAADLCKQAADALISNRWTSSQDAEKVAAALADPTTALATLVQVVKAASERLRTLETNPALLASGTAVPGQGPAQTKAASAGGWGASPPPPPSEADEKFFNRIMAAH